MKQMTKKQAIKFFESNAWQEMSAQEIVKLQLYQERLCVPFGEFHKSIEEVLERPVFTHEFAFDGIRKEYEGKCGAPSFEEIIALIPEDKLILVGV